MEKILIKFQRIKTGKKRKKKEIERAHKGIEREGNKKEEPLIPYRHVELLTETNYETETAMDCN